MKRSYLRMIAIVLLLMLALSHSIVFADSTWYCSVCGQQFPGSYNYCPYDGTHKSAGASSYNSGSSVYGLAKTRLSTRSGPGTKYTEPGTFNVSGQYVRICSITYDENDVGWVEVELNAEGKLFRAYTGIQRFDTATFNVSSVTHRSTGYYATRYLTTFCYLRTGPGWNYAEAFGDPGNSYPVYSSTQLKIVGEEGDWYEVEVQTGYNISGTSSVYTLRGWVPKSYTSAY